MPREFPAKKIRSAHYYGNGNMLVIGEDGEQAGEVQHNLFILWAENAERLGFEPEGVQIVTDSAIWRIFRTEDGFNIEKV